MGALEKKISPVNLGSPKTARSLFEFSGEVLTNVAQIVSVNGSGAFPPKLDQKRIKNKRNKKCV